MSDEIHEEVRDAQRASMSYHGSEIHLKMQDQALALNKALDVAYGESADHRQSHAMLSQIAGLVEEFCDEKTTTLDGVKLMKAELYELRAEKLRQEAGWE